MVVCVRCRRDVPLLEVANPDAYDGGPTTVCASCNGSARREAGRLHWRERRDQADPLRRRPARSTVLPASTVEEVWDLCERCAGYLETRESARFRDGSAP
jgi:hypothetical protein